MPAAPILSEAICDWISPHSSSGCRTFCSMSARMGSTSLPASNSFNGGMRRPSWKISVALEP